MAKCWPYIMRTQVQIPSIRIKKTGMVVWSGEMETEGCQTVKLSWCAPDSVRDSVSKDKVERD